MQMYIFFEELHESTKDRFIANKPFTYFGVFNGVEKKDICGRCTGIF